MQRTAYPIWEILLFRSCANSYSYTLAYSQSSIKSYASYSLLKNSSIEISSIGLLEQCSLLHYLIIFFFGRSGMIFLAFLQVRIFELIFSPCGRRICQGSYTIKERAWRDRKSQVQFHSLLMGGRARIATRSLILLAIGLQLTSSLDIDFLTFKWKVLIPARI
jgi:hypothetical protein